MSEAEKPRTPYLFSAQEVMGGEAFVYYSAVTLRDLFAAFAMAGMWAAAHRFDDSIGKVFAGASYEQADAMLRAREKGPKE